MPEESDIALSLRITWTPYSSFALLFCRAGGAREHGASEFLALYSTCSCISLPFDPYWGSSGRLDTEQLVNLENEKVQSAKMKHGKILVLICNARGNLWEAPLISRICIMRICAPILYPLPNLPDTVATAYCGATHLKGASIKYVRTEGEGGGDPKAYVVREVA